MPSVFDGSPSRAPGAMAQSRGYFGERYGGWGEACVLFVFYIAIAAALHPRIRLDPSAAHMIATILGATWLACAVGAAAGVLSLPLTRQIVVSLLVAETVASGVFFLGIYGNLYMQIYAQYPPEARAQAYVERGINNAAFYGAMVRAALPLVPILIYLPVAIIRARRGHHN